jgi:hypothetical protein
LAIKKVVIPKYIHRKSHSFAAETGISEATISAERILNNKLY